MPLKLSVGLSRKQGLPHYGSAGASCLLEMELSADALREQVVFFEQAEKALEACRVVVETELSRQSKTANTNLPLTARHPTGDGEISSTKPKIAVTAPSYQERSGDRLATPRQLQAIERLALRIGANPAEWLYQRIGQSPLHSLSLAHASSLIDELQQQLTSSLRKAS